MIRDQIMIVPVNYIHFDNGFTGASISTKDSYTCYDNISVYRPIDEINKNICLIKIAVMLLLENEQGQFLAKCLYDKNQRPSIELGLNSYIKSYSGNHKAIYNQLEAMTNQHNYKFIGNIRDLANKSVKSILGCVYYCKSDFVPEPSDSFTYEWLDTKTLMNNYSKFTSWSKPFIDMLVDNTFYNYI
jgi:predicted NUDIX family phosphoesterase